MSAARRRAPGDGSIYQIKDGTWLASVEVGASLGMRRRRYFTGKTREEARQRMLEAQREGIGRTGKAEQILTITDLADAWLAASERRVAHRTFASYQDVVEAHIKPTLGRVKKRDLTPTQIENALRIWMTAPKRSNWKVKDGTPRRKRAEIQRLSATTVRYNLTVLRILLNWAVRMREIPYNPALAVDKPAATEFEGEVLTPHEFADLVAYARTWRTGDFSVPILVAAATGIRRGELCGLRRGDVDFENDLLEVARAVEVRRDGRALAVKVPKGKKARTIAIPRVATEALARRFAEQDLRLGSATATTPIFDDAGEIMHPDTFGKEIGKIIKSWGKVPVRLHDLRHSFGSWLANAGTSDRVLRAQLRHTDPKQSERYTSHVDPAQRAAAMALDETLRAALGDDPAGS